MTDASAACGGQAGGAPDTDQQENSTTPVSDESTPSGNSSTPAAPETITITSLDYLQSYVTDANISNLGTIKEADLEAVMACEPDVIFIGGRLSKSYDALSEIAPVVYLATDSSLGVVESVRKNAATIASIFGLEDQVAALMGGFDSRVETLKTSTHRNEASFEFIVDQNPEYIFVMDCDAAIATEGAQLAQEILENELVMGTDAYKNGHIVYLAHPAVWYTAEGGITALDLMLADLESTLLS